MNISLTTMINALILFSILPGCVSTSIGSDRGKEQGNEGEQQVIDAINYVDGVYLGSGKTIPLSTDDPLNLNNSNEQEITPAETAAFEPSVERWSMTQGEKLSDGLQTWLDQAGWDLVWKSRVDYSIASSLGFSGTLESAVEDLIMLYSHSENPLYADISPRQRLVVVSDDPKELGE